MKRLTIILTLLMINLIVSAQREIGIKANGGLSRLSTKINSGQQQTQKFYFVPSGQGGLFCNFHLRNKFLLGAELLFIQIEGKEYLEIHYTDIKGNLTGAFGQSNIWRHLSYLGVPVYFGYDFKKLNVNIGFQANLLLASSGRKKGQATDAYGTTITTWDKKWTPDSLCIDNYDFGIRAGIFYNLSDRCTLEANYYYGLNNILKNQIGSWKWTVQQMTIGLRYKIFTTGQKSTTANK